MEKAKQQELERILQRLDGAGIKYFREGNLLSQDALARKIGVSLRTVWRWENKPEGISKQAQLKIRAGFGKYLLTTPYYQRYLQSDYSK